MPKILFAMTLIGALMLMACGFSKPLPTPVPIPTLVPVPAGAEEVKLDITDFNQETIEIKTGTAVTWTHRGKFQHTTTHTPLATGELKEWDSDILAPGEVFRHVFNTPGTYQYVCRVHAIRMKATVTVVE